jgi:hypothetical protein
MKKEKKMTREEILKSRFFQLKNYELNKLFENEGYQKRIISKC